MMQQALPSLELRKAEREETDRNQIIAHELKRPAVAMIAASSILKKAIIGPDQIGGPNQIGTQLDSRVTRQLVFLNRYAETLSILVARAQYLAAGREVRPTLRKTNLMSKIIAPTIKLLRAELEELDLNAHLMRYEDFFELPPVWVDRDMFQQVVFNLLDNAIKYRKPERWAFKILVTAKDVGDRLELRFTDWGVGVREDLAAHIFDKGRRGDRSHQHAFGLGIGLWVVVELLRLHESSITLENNAEPTVFRVDIPKKLATREWQGRGSR
jgi:signal transduction histidine kinase